MRVPPQLSVRWWRHHGGQTSQGSTRHSHGVQTHTRPTIPSALSRSSVCADRYVPAHGHKARTLHNQSSVQRIPAHRVAPATHLLLWQQYAQRSHGRAPSDIPGLVTRCSNEHHYTTTRSPHLQLTLHYRQVDVQGRS